MLFPFFSQIQDTALACLPVLFSLRHFADRSPGSSGGGGGTRTLHSLLCDTLVQIRLHPPLFYMTAVQLNQPFFSSMANYSLFNTNPSKTKVSWDLIQPNIIHVQLWVSCFIYLFLRQEIDCKDKPEFIPKFARRCLITFHIIPFILFFYFPEDRRKLSEEAIVNSHWQFIFHFHFFSKGWLHASQTSISWTKSCQNCHIFRSPNISHHH